MARDGAEFPVDHIGEPIGGNWPSTAGRWPS